MEALFGPELFKCVPGGAQQLQRTFLQFDHNFEVSAACRCGAGRLGVVTSGCKLRLLQFGGTPRGCPTHFGQDLLGSSMRGICASLALAGVIHWHISRACPSPHCHVNSTTCQEDMPCSFILASTIQYRLLLLLPNPSTATFASWGHRQSRTCCSPRLSSRVRNCWCGSGTCSTAQASPTPRWVSLWAGESLNAKATVCALVQWPWDTLRHQ